MTTQTDFIDRVRVKSRLIQPSEPFEQPHRQSDKPKPGFFMALYTETRPLISEAVWLVALAVTFALPAMLWMDVRPAHAVIGAAAFILGGMVLRPTRTR